MFQETIQSQSLTNVFLHDRNQTGWRACGRSDCTFCFFLRVLTFVFSMRTVVCSTRPVRVTTRRLHSTLVTVSMFEPPSLQFLLSLCVSCQRSWSFLLLVLGRRFSVSDEETYKQALAVIRVTLFGPPATCKLVTTDWMFSICSTGTSWLALA